MSTIRSITTLALALGAAAAPQLVQFTPVQPPRPDVPKVHAPSVTPPAFPTVEPTAPTVPPININKDLILEPALPNVELKGPKVARNLPVKLTPQDLEISVSAPIVVPTAGAVSLALDPREDDFPVDLNAIQPPKPVLPNVSTPTLSVKIPDVVISYPKVPNAPKLPRRNIKIPESVIPTQSVDLQAISSIISALGGLVTARNAEPQPANVVLDLPAATSVLSVLGDIKSSVAAREIPTPLPVVSSVLSVIGDIKAAIIPRQTPDVLPIVSSIASVAGGVKAGIIARETPEVLPIVSSVLSGVKAAVVPRETPEVLSIVSSVVGGIKVPVVARETPEILPVISSAVSGIKAAVVPRETPEVLPIVSSVLSSVKGPVVARETPAALPIVSSVASVVGDIKASLLPRALPVEVPSTTVDIAAVKTVTAVLESIIASVDSRDLAAVDVTIPSVTVQLPIVSSVLSVLSNAAGTGLPMKAARGALPNVPAAVVAVGVDVPAFTATVPVPALVAVRTAIDLPLSTLIQVPSISKIIELPAVQTPELKGKFTAGKRTTAGVIGDVQGKIDEILSAVPQ
ncbi:hypothetical protein CGCTS75_v007499 [Colletotrichum tropicale]|nr:hypothetical protein CGCTS75_v007499 [Colletotrichum tropicale]